MFQRLGLALCTPLLLWLAWPEAGITPFLFTGFVPLLFLEQQLSGARAWFWLTWLSFAVWNVMGAWWVGQADWIGVIATVFFSALPMSLVMVLFRFVKNKLGSQRGYIALPFLWICMEGLHKYWDFSFPWFILGNGFADRVSWVQWYEYTGSFGGSLWAWIVNIVVFLILSSFSKHREWKPLTGQLILTLVLLILLPILLSHQRYSNYKDKGPQADVVVIQPNIDTYTEKFELSEAEQLQKLIKLAKPMLDDSTDFLIGPETYLPKGIWEDRFDQSIAINMLRQLCDTHPDLHIIIGATTLRHYEYQNSSYTARPMENEDGYFDLYNTALFINRTDSVHTYHKSKLVAGVEMMPLFRYIEPFFGEYIRFKGGVSGTLATQKKRENFISTNKQFKVAPIICWESDFGEYVGGYVRNGANLLTVITNDDWWGNTQGHIQHMHYSRLRAIENRRSIARSANTGISCFINQRGDVMQARSYKKDAAIRLKIHANNELTYYAETGDLLLRMSWFMSGFFMLYSLVYGHLRKKKSLA
ncbi:MAG: apolipoprotein N-acyltransferase [Owenweeksia sp.]